MRYGMLCILLTLIGCATAPEKGADFRYFDKDNKSYADAEIPAVAPWKSIPLDPEYGGMWVVAGDVDGDGTPEIVSAENYNLEDTHYTSAVVAQRLDGSVLWRWGNPAIGRKTWHHDVACQIHDWDHDGKNEVILCAEKALIELDGATGVERRRWPIPAGMSDCLVFCDLEGKGYPSDVIIKDRYHTLMAYDYTGRRLWQVTDPGGCRTAHQPYPVDIDHDGRQEIMAGYVLLNPDGSIRWQLTEPSPTSCIAHLDCCRILKKGKNPEDFRLALTCCGDNRIEVVDGNGKILWACSGQHFESIDVGCVIPRKKAPQLLVDIDHLPEGQGPLWLFGAEGEKLGKLMTEYGRHHELLDWDGDGYDDILVADAQRIFNYEGKPVVRFTLPPFPETAFEKSALLADMTGDGVPDILFVTPDRVSIFKNERGRRPSPPFPLGTGMNRSLY